MRGLRQRNLFSLNLFKFVMESVLRTAGVNPHGIIFQRSVQLLAHVNGRKIIGRTKRDVTADFSSIELESKMGLAVNESKRKYTQSTI